ncbi:MAG: hypothetical protein IT379_07240 [Deltaproteobacteria bacterium]|nr:hypothetical protein [Deltaproteobacteria bacterium]
MSGVEQMPPDPLPGDGTMPPRGTPPGAPPPTMPEWVLGFDLNNLNRFVEGNPPTHPIAGRVISTFAVDELRINDAPTTVGGDGSFNTTVPVMPGVNVVPITVTDQAGHARNGHRALINTAFLPEGEINPIGAGMTVSNELLESLIAPFRAEIEGLNLAEQLGGAGAFSQGGCDINLNNITHGRPTLTLVNGAGGNLVATFTVPNVRVTFSGFCSLFITSSTVSGTMTTNVAVSTNLFAPPGNACITGLQHTPPVVDLPGFDLDISLGGGGLISAISPIVGEIMEGSVSDTMKEEIAAKADELFTEQASRLALLSDPTDIDFQGTSLHLQPCLTGLGPENGVLRGRLGVAVTGPGGYPAPGAPQVAGDMPPAQAGSLWIDANLLSQMFFAIWRAGGLETEVNDQIEFGLLGLLVPDLRDRYPADTPVTIAIQAHLPPVVRAAEPGMGDLIVEIGDLMIELKVGDELLFRIGILVRLTVELMPVEGRLIPMVTGTTSEAHLLDEPIADVDDAVLEGAVGGMVGGAAGAFFGEEGFALPDLGFPINPRDVVAEPGGRFLRLVLE